MAKPFMLLTCQQANFEWTPSHNTAFLTLKESVIQTPILYYLDPTKCYIVYTDKSEDASGSTTLTRTRWHGIPNSFSFTYLHANAKEIEQHRTRSSWCVLCSHKMELLPPRS